MQRYGFINDASKEVCGAKGITIIRSAKTRQSFCQNSMTPMTFPKESHRPNEEIGTGTGATAYTQLGSPPPPLHRETHEHR